MDKVRTFLSSEKTYVLLLIGLLCAQPFSYAISNILLIALLFFSLLSLIFHKPTFKSAYVVPMLLYAMILLSLCWTINMKESLRGLEREIALLLIPFSFICMPSLTQRGYHRIMYHYAIGMTIFGVFMMILALLRFAFFDSAEVFFYHGLVDTLNLNAIYISVFAAFALLYLYFEPSRTRLRVGCMLLLGLFVFLLSSKIITVITGILIGAGSLRNLKRNKMQAGVIIGILGLILLMTIPNPLRERFQREMTLSDMDEVLNKKKFTKTYDWTGTSIRIFQGRILLEMLNEDHRFLTGYGVNAAQEKIKAKHRSYNLYPGYYNYNFHNQYLQSLAELGIGGLLLTIALLVVVFLNFLKTRDLFQLSFFLIMFALFFTESYLWRQRGLYYFLILYCLFIKCLPNTVFQADQKSGT